MATEAKKAEKSIDVKKPQEQKNEIKQDGDMQTIIANAIKEAINPLNEELAKIKGEKITTTRTSELDSILKDAPKSYKDQVLEGFGRMNFENEEDFASFKETTKTNFGSFQQMAKEQGVVFNTPSLDVQKPIDSGQDQTLASALKMATDAKKKD